MPSFQSVQHSSESLLPVQLRACCVTARPRCVLPGFCHPIGTLPTYCGVELGFIGFHPSCISARNSALEDQCSEYIRSTPCYHFSGVIGARRHWPASTNPSRLTNVQPSYTAHTVAEDLAHGALKPLECIHLMDSGILNEIKGSVPQL